MHGLTDECSSGRLGRKRARAGSVKAAIVSIVLLMTPQLPSAESLKLSSTSEDRGHLGLGLLRAVEVVRGRYERAWALVSSSEPTADDLDAALELLQANAKQWESLEPAVKLWAEREKELPEETTADTTAAKKQAREQSVSDRNGSSDVTGEQQRYEGQSQPGAPGVSEGTSRIYEEAASLLAYNRSVLGQALARTGHTGRGIEELEVACPEIMEHQQNARGRRDSKSWLHCYANLAEMYKTQKRFEDASNLLARMPWLPSPQQAWAEADEAADLDSASLASSPPSSSSSYASTAEHGPDVVAPLGSSSSVEDDDDEALLVLLAGGQPVDESLPVSREGSGVVDHTNNDSTGEQSTSSLSSLPTTTTTTTTTTMLDSSSSSFSSNAVEEGRGSSCSSSSGGNASKGGSGRSDSFPQARGAGAARIAGLNKAAIAAAATAAAAQLTGAPATETGAEAAARAVVERHAEVMRASMNELVGELAVTTATRPSASQDWLESRVVAAEEVLAAVRAGLLSVAAAGSSSEPSSSGGDTAENASVLPVGTPGHADILREASHYLSAIKGVAAQGWAYVDNELRRMERHPEVAVRPGFQSRREVIHTFRYLLMKARQYASENQSQTTAGSATSQGGGGSRSRRKDRGRKASASSKAPRKGTGARKSSPRSDADATSTQTDGFFTLFVGAGVALLVAAFSSGRSRGHGRRREVVRQRTATRAAKTVGSYVEPPQRSAATTVVVYAWGNLKRSGRMLSAHATTYFIFTQTTLLKAFRAAFERLGREHHARFGAGAKALTAAATKKAGSAAQGHHKQRSRKSLKKACGASAPVAVLTREPTVMITPPVSPRAQAQTAAEKEPRGVPPVAGVAPVVVDVGTSAGDASKGPPGCMSSRPAGEDDATAVSQHSAIVVDEIAVKTAVSGATSPTRIHSPAVVTGATVVASTQKAAEAAAVAAAVLVAADLTAGVPFPEVMTAEQVQAMVEEDERAWEQARVSETLQRRAAGASAGSARPQRAAAASAASWHGAVRGMDVTPSGVASDGLANDGWSEVGASGGSKARVSGGRGRILSMCNVRAATRASRPSSPGSDPATTTSASSSDCSDGSKDKPIHHHSTASSSRDGRVSGRPSQGSGRAAAPRAGSGSTWGHQSSRGSGSSGGHEAARAARPRQTRGPPPPPPPSSSSSVRAQTREAEWGSASRSSRPSYAPWTTARSAQPTQSTSRVRRGGVNSSTRPSSTQKGDISSVAANTMHGQKSYSWDVAPTTERAKTKSLRRPLQEEVPKVHGVRTKGAEVNGAEEEEERFQPSVPAETAPVAEVAAPIAWTNTPSHPLGMKAEPAPLPPASEPPRPPPQHQQHWQRQQARQQQAQQQQRQQHQQQFFHHQKQQPPMSMSTAPPVHGGGHYLAPPPHELLVPQHPHPSSSEDAFPPPSVHMAGSEGVVAPTVYVPPHPVHISCPSPAASPGGRNHQHYHVVPEGTYDSPTNNDAGASACSPDGGALAHPLQMVPVPLCHEQQRQQQCGRFSPLTLMHNSEDGAGGASPSVYGPGPSVGYATVSGGVGSGPAAAVAAEALEALMGALCWQVEYYFSVENLMRDVYLRNLMDIEGFVAVSKIIVFNRVRSMTSDMSVLVAAIRQSSELELLEQDHAGEVKVRTRHSPLHWVQEQLPPSTWTSPAVAFEREDVTFEPERASYEEEHASGDGGAVCCEREQD